MSSNQTVLAKDRVAVQIQLNEYAFIAHDMLVKHLCMFKYDSIDVGVLILPMQDFEQYSSSDLPYYERELQNLVSLGKGNPAVPLVLIGVLP